jgi:hypothetical protein
MTNNINLKNIVSQFCVNGGVGNIVPFGFGHINDTYLVKNTDSTGRDYLL